MRIFSQIIKIQGRGITADKNTKLSACTKSDGEASAPPLYEVQTPSTLSRIVPRFLMITSMLSIILLAAPLPIARAAPWRTLYSRQSNGNGNPNNNNSGFSSSVWVRAPYWCSSLPTDTERYTLLDSSGHYRRLIAHLCRLVVP